MGYAIYKGINLLVWSLGVQGLAVTLGHKWKFPNNNLQKNEMENAFRP